MSKYYKAEDVIAFLNLHCPKDMWEYQIADLPTIDIVHCGECKRANHELSGVYCGLSDVLMGEDGFCSIGKRSE